MAAATVVVGIVLSAMSMTAWRQFDGMTERLETSEAWVDTGDYAIFYPRLIGEDQAAIESGDLSSQVREAQELYPVLEEAGALYVDAGNYQVGIPNDPPYSLPVWPIEVNGNYLERYPILDETNTPIVVDPTDPTWVVAVPEQYKHLETELLADFTRARVGAPGFTGQAQAHVKLVGEPVPERLVDQKVRIIWTAGGQEVFSFDPEVNPDAGNMIVDPIVEIMTPGNSLPVDYMNASTGGLDAAMKVRVDGDPAAVHDELMPLLERLDVDDNLPYLVTGQEALLGEAAEARSGLIWTGGFMGIALAIMVALNVALVATVHDRMRRTLIVRRLHGFGFLKSYGEVLRILGIVWIVHAVLAALVVMQMTVSRSGRFPGDEVSPFIDMPRLGVVLIATLIVEGLLVLVVAGIVERRHAVARLKEM